MQDEASATGKVLTIKEEAICQRIASETEPHGKRARALLLVNNGRTQRQAALESALSIGQVQYCVSRFRKLRLGIFPDQILGKDQIRQSVPLTDTKAKKPKKKLKSKKNNRKVKKVLTEEKNKKMKKKVKKGKAGKKKNKGKQGGKKKGGNGKVKKKNKPNKKGKKAKKK